RSAHPPSVVSDEWPADHIGLPVYAPLFWDSVSDCRVRTEPCCAASCAPRLPPASAAVRSPAPAARSHPKTGPIAAARMPLPAPTPRRDGSDLPHSSKLECHDLLNLSSPFTLMPVFTLLPNGKHWLMPLRERLLKAIHNAQAPIFLLQAGNDYSAGPSEVL